MPKLALSPIGLFSAAPALAAIAAAGLSGASQRNSAGPISTSSCVGANNETGVPGELSMFGNILAVEDDARLIVSQVPPGQFGMFVFGLLTVPAGTVLAGNGHLCLDPNAMTGLGRFDGPGQLQQVDAAGQADLDTNVGEWSLTSIPISTGTFAAMGGTTLHFQFWHRESVGAGFNFSGLCSVSFQ